MLILSPYRRLKFWFQLKAPYNISEFLLHQVGNRHPRDASIFYSASWTSEDTLVASWSSSWTSENTMEALSSCRDSSSFHAHCIRLTVMNLFCHLDWLYKTFSTTIEIIPKIYILIVKDSYNQLITFRLIFTSAAYYNVNALSPWSRWLSTVFHPNLAI